MGGGIRAGLAPCPDSEGGSGPKFQGPAPPHSASGQFRDPFQSGRTQEGSGYSGTETSYYPSTGSFFTRFLQPALPSAKALGRGQASNRLVPTQQNSGGTIVPDGNSAVCQGSDSTGRMGHKYRYQRRLSPRTDGDGNPEILAVQGGVRGPSIQVPTFRPVHVTPGIYKAASTNRTVAEGSRNPCSCLSGRLVDPFRFPSAGTSRCYPCSKRHSGLRLGGESEQVMPRTLTGLHFPGDAFQHQYRCSDSSTIGRHQGQAQPETSIPANQPGSDSTTVDFTIWTGPVHGCSGTSWPPATPPPSVGSHRSVESSYRSLDRQDRVTKRVPDETQLVGVSSCAVRSTNVTSGSIRDSIHRRVRFRLGSNCGSPESSRSVADAPTEMAHKRPRDPSSLGSSTCLRFPSDGQNSPGDDRQPDGSVLSPVLRRHAVQSSQQPGSESTTASQEAGNCTQTSLHSGCQECRGRWPLASGSNTRVGVVHQSQSTGGDIPTDGSPVARHVRHQGHQEIGPICESVPRSRSLRDRCPSAELGQLGVNLCISPDKDSERSDQEVCELFGSPNDPGSPPQGLSLLGPRLAQTLSIETEVTFQSETVTSGGSGPRENIPQSAQLFKPSRLASLVAIYHSQGFSLEAAELMARPQRTSTTTLYQSRWVSFMEWLRAKGSLPDQVTLSMFTDYLVALFNKGLSPSAIKGHRAAVGAVYKALNSFDASNDIHLTHLMRRFQVERPRKRITMPRWDLGIVLRSFLRAPYVIDSAGSDHGIDLKWLTLKTVFLVALASGRRVSYIRALAYEFTLNRGSVHSQHVLALSTLPEFRAKNQRSSDKPMFVSLPGIAHLVPQEPERFLCPVRCLRMYAHVTADRHNHCPRMFVHWLPGKADITSGSISRWIMLAVRKAYVATGQNAPSGISAHELRALSASWAYTNHADLDDIKAALFWRSSGVFQDSYLRNMASSRNELNRLGPLVTAGMVIDPR